MLNEDINIKGKFNFAIYPLFTTINGWSGSTAEEFANNQGINFIPLDENDYNINNVIIDKQYKNLLDIKVTQVLENKKIELLCLEEGKIVDSFKVNGQTIEGNIFTMPNNDVNITDISIVDEYIVESNHYPYITGKTFCEKKFENAIGINIEIEYDLYDYDSNSYALRLYTTENSSWVEKYLLKNGHASITFDSNYLKIDMDSYYFDLYQYYGFRAVIKPVYE